MSTTGSGSVMYDEGWSAPAGYPSEDSAILDGENDSGNTYSGDGVSLSNVIPPGLESTIVSRSMEVLVPLAGKSVENSKLSYHFKLDEKNRNCSVVCVYIFHTEYFYYFCTYNPK